MNSSCNFTHWESRLICALYVHKIQMFGYNSIQDACESMGLILMAKFNTLYSNIIIYSIHVFIYNVWQHFTWYIHRLPFMEVYKYQGSSTFNSLTAKKEKQFHILHNNKIHNWRHHILFHWKTNPTTVLHFIRMTYGSEGNKLQSWVNFHL